MKSVAGMTFSAVMCMLIAVAVASLPGCSNLPPEHAKVVAAAGLVSIPLSQVNDGRVHFYTYRYAGKNINLLVRTDGAGNVSACFDACFTCYKHKKGYRVEGTDLVCNECGLKFRLADEKWDNSKGCSPISLRSRIESNALVIDASELEKGARLF